MPVFAHNLCFKHTAGTRHLAYKHDSAGHLIYKSGADDGHGTTPPPPGRDDETGDDKYLNSWAEIIITWDSQTRDIDTMSYWMAEKANAVGWSYKAGDERGTYRHRWMGDDTGAGGKERIYVAICPGWNTAGANLHYIVHLNAFGYDAQEYPGNTATVTAVSEWGVKLEKTIQTGKNSEKEATDADPKVTITFSNTGIPTAIN